MSERKKFHRKEQKKDSPLSLTKAKKQLRSLERQLQNRRDSIPANIIVEKERAIKALKTQLIDLQATQKAKELTQKYKLVRFFEKKKSIRQYKSTLKEYNRLNEKFSEEDENKELKKELKKLRKKLAHCEIDVLYNSNFPYDRKYISLYPKESDETDENVKKGKLITDARRSEFKKEIELKLKENTLPLSLDDILNGKTNMNIFSKKPELEQEPDAPDATEEIEEEEDDFFE